MVIDKLENAKLYSKLGDRLARAFAYLNNTDLLQTPPGKYAIADQDIFAIIQEYDTREIAECKLERHFNYLDIQYIISGVEQIGVALLDQQVPVEINKEKDYAFYEGDSTLIRMDAGMFALFFPYDLHRPGVKYRQTSPVKKVVIKVRLDEQESGQ